MKNDIAMFEAVKFHNKYRSEFDEAEELLRQKEETVDFFLAMALGFFFGSWVITGFYIMNM